MCENFKKMISQKSFLLTLALVTLVKGHGRMMDPPNRSSLWRFPQFADVEPPINYNDNELFCGGIAMQYGVNGGRCGICGDAYNAPRPRDNENGGTYGNGIIAKSYSKGQEIEISVELTAGHLGSFEFRICNLDSSFSSEDEDCFEKNVLQLSNGVGTKFPIPSVNAAWYSVTAILPSELTCDHCVLQWQYTAGNSWGECEDGNWAIGCGPQETFRGCSDISIIG